MNIIGVVLADNDPKSVDPSVKSKAVASLQDRSPGFEENIGQLADNIGNPIPSVLYRMATPDMQILVTTKGLSYFFLEYTKEETEKEELTSGIKSPEDKPEERRINYCHIDMELKGASIVGSNIIAEYSSLAYSNYYYPHCIDGILNVRQYKKLTVKNVYPGIDWVIYLNDKNELKYDFVVTPGADHKLIRLCYLSLNKLNFKETGDISMRTDIGNLSERSPVSFTQGSNEEIPTQFIRINESSKYGGHQTEIGFEVRSFDTNKTLVIDPQIQWFTDFSFSGGFLGISDISVNKQNGNLVLTGYTSNLGMPIYDPGNGAFFQGTLMGMQNVFVTELTSTGAVIWSTFFGGFNDGQTSGTGMAAEWDGLGNVFVTGNIRNLPLKNPGGGAYYSATAAGSFISKFDAAGSLIWSTYLGQGSGADVITNNANEVYLVATAQNAGVVWPTFNPGGGAYFQGTNTAPAFGSRPYIARFSNNGNLLWGTFFGAAAGAPGFATSCRDIAIDRNTGKIYITGQGDLPVLMNAGGFYQPTVGGFTDTYVAGFNSSNSLIWSTYLGGAAIDYPCAIHCDDLGNIVLTGITNSTNFPIKNPGAGAYFQGAIAGGYDIYIAKFNPSTNMFWSTYYGGSLDDQSMANGDAYKPDIVTDKKNNIYVTGMTSSLNFPTYNSGCGGFLYNTGCNVIMQFCPSGVRLWATKFGEEGGYNGTNLGTANRFTSACAFDDATNSVYAGGEVYGPTMINPLVNPGGGALFNSPFTAGDCSFIIKFKILPVTLTMNSVNATSCSGCNGTATVTATCGLAPYTYSWNNGQSTQTATGLCAGIYSVIVKDAGCEQDTAYVTINSGSGSMTLTINKTDAGCGINNGTAIAIPGSGAGPYTYSWSNGQMGQTASGLSVGSYTVSVTDSGGCFSTRSVTVSQPSAIVVNVNSSTQIICNNSINVAVSGSGGAIPYVYNWNNGQAGATATGLVAGTYTVTATDASGCSATRSVVVTKLPPAFFSIYTTNGTCGNGGTATVFVYGGTQPYTYSWSGLSQTTSNITAVPAGTYTIAVIDASGCTSTKSFTITDTPALASATFTQSPAGTTVCVGTLVNFTNTGNPPGTGVTYNWVISPTTPAISGTTTDFSYMFLTAGSYTVSHAVSASGCSKVVTSTVNVITCSAGPTAMATGTSVCPGTCGTATSSAAGGSVPYTYTWSNGATTQNINVCPAATTTYTVTIKDSGGNTSTSTAMVTVSPVVTVSTTVTNITCNGTTDGSATATGAGGTSPYTYSWSNVMPGSGSSVSGLSAGNYTVTITDSKGCTSASSATIISPPALTGQFTKGTANCVACGCKEWILVNASGGTSPYSYTWPDGYLNRYKNQLCPGNYSVNVKDKNGCSINVVLISP